MVDNVTPRGLPSNKPLEENREDPVVERIRKEGSLIRNDGKHSLRAIGQKIDKFGPIMDSIGARALEQTNLLAEIASTSKFIAGKMGVEQKQLALEHNRLLSELLASHQSESRMAQERTRLQALANQSSNVPSQPMILPNGRPATYSPQHLPAQDDGNFISNLMAGAGGGLAALVSSYALRKIGGAGLTALMAPLIGGWLGDFVGTLADDAGFAKGVSEALSGGMERGTIGAMVGSIFGARYAAIFGAAGLASSFSDELMDAMGVNKDTVLASIGDHKIDMDSLTGGILSVVGIGVTAALTDPKLAKSITDAVKKGVGPALKGSGINLLRGSIGAGVVTSYLLYGDEVEGWLEKQGLEPGFADMAVDVAGAASLGAMFGPTGALAFGAIALALGIGKSILGWFSDTSDSVREKAYEGLDEVKKIIEEGGVLDDGMVAKVQPAMAEAGRTKNLVGQTEETRARNEQVLRDGRKILGVQAANMPLDVNSMTTMFMSALDHDLVQSKIADFQKTGSNADRLGVISAIGDVTGKLSASAEDIAYTMQRLDQKIGVNFYASSDDVSGLVDRRPKLPASISPTSFDSTPLGVIQAPGTTSAIEGSVRASPAPLGDAATKVEAMAQLNRETANSIIYLNNSPNNITINRGGDRTNSSSVTNIGSGYGDLSPSFGN